MQEGLVKKAYIGESMYEYRVRAIGNDAEAEGYLNNMAQERWALKFAFSVGDTSRAQYVTDGELPPNISPRRRDKTLESPVNMRPSGHTVHVSGV